MILKGAHEVCITSAEPNDLGQGYKAPGLIYVRSMLGVGVEIRYGKRLVILQISLIW